MRDIATMSSRLNVLLDEKVLPKLIEAQRNTAKKIWEEVVENVPVKSGTYLSSIQISDTENQDGVIKTSIFSDLLVGGNDPKWSKVPLGAFIEWGTGIVGANSNTFPHGYGYTLVPWTYWDKYLHMFVTTIGQPARPHFYPALQNNVAFYKEQIKEAFR